MVVLLSQKIKLYRSVQIAITCVRTLLKPYVTTAAMCPILARLVEQRNVTLRKRTASIAPKP
jgi:hypothetical protein